MENAWGVVHMEGKAVVVGGGGPRLRAHAKPGPSRVAPKKKTWAEPC